MKNLKFLGCVLTLATICVCIGIIVFKLRDRYLIWNLFLAWLPIVGAMNFYKINTIKKKSEKIFLSTISFFFWLFFYPNSFYMVTDFIHISKLKFYYNNPDFGVISNAPRVIYIFDGKAWATFFCIAMAAFLACSIGSFSLYLIQQVLEKRSSKMVSWSFVLAVNCLCGYALYIGRFIRFNSWDIITKPAILFKFFINNLNRKALIYSTSFAVFSLFIYLCFYIFIYIGKVSNDK